MILVCILRWLLFNEQYDVALALLRYVKWLQVSER